jgi:DNA-binding LacI/PurR family transcriptional regulator
LTGEKSGFIIMNMKRFISETPPSARNYTMKDVAKAGGVSLGTVSNVLNGVPTVSEKNRQKTLAAISLLNYSPNITARTLKTKRSYCIGLIVSDIHNPFYSEFARGVEDLVHAMGYKLFLCNSDRNAGKEQAYVDALIKGMVDGLILMKTRLPSSTLAEIGARVSVVLVDTCGDEDHGGCDFVGVNDYDGITQALGFLWNYKHRRIAMIAGPQDSLSARERVRSFFDFFNARGYGPADINIRYSSYDWHGGYDCAKKLLDGSRPPTAVLAANDLMAIGAMKALRERGLFIPRDISVVGFDDINMASLCIPALTTVKQPKYEMGEYSARKLLKRIELVFTAKTAAPKKNGKKRQADKKGAPGEKAGGDAETGVTVLKTELIIRDSVSFNRPGRRFCLPGLLFSGISRRDEL